MVVGKIYRFPPISRFIRYEVKGLMRKVLAMICDQLPEPDTHVESQGAKNLLKLRDYFLSHDMEPENDKIIRGFFNILAIIYDFDIYWSERVDEGVYLIKDMPWQRKDNQEPRYQWWLKEHDPPPHTSIVELLRAERGHAMRRHDNQVASRLKVIQNMVEGLAGTENYSDKWWIPLNNDIPIEYLLAARESLREGDEPIHGELQGEPIHGELQGEPIHGEL